MGKKIGLISGCFAGLHKGHLYILSEIKKQCDYLVVCLNSDKYLSKKKGDRSQWTFEQRKCALYSTNLVDEVIGIEDTPIDIIMMIKPQLIFTGSDYCESQIVGAKECAEWGGKAVTIKRIAGYSTTELIAANEN